MKEASRGLLMFVVAACAVVLQAAAGAGGFEWITDFRIRDPFVLLDGGRYWLYESKPWSGGDGVAVRCSDDLSAWTKKKSAMVLPKGFDFTAVWAPEVHKYKGKYYMFVTLTEKSGARVMKPMGEKKGTHGLAPRGTWVFVSDSPAGPFKPVKKGPVPPADLQTLDGTLYVEDGKPYMVYCHEWCQMGNGTIEYAELSDDLSSFKTKPVKLLDAKSAVPGASFVTDGPFFYRSEKSSRLYMVWSNNIKGHGYSVLVRSSASGRIAGPWTSDSLLVGGNGGHAMLFKDKSGALMMTLHRPNVSPHERMRLLRIEDDGETLRAVSEVKPKKRNGFKAFQIACADYLAFGQLIPSGQQEIVKHAGLQVLHSDGAVTLRLKETGRSESFDDASSTLTIRMSDEHYPFEVVRHIKRWNDCDAVETWLEIRHSEPGPVKLLRADSFASRIDVKAQTVKVLSLAGTWGREANVRVSEVAPGQSVQLLSLSGVRNAWESNPAMMVEFGADVDEDRGNVLGVALEWTGTTERRIRRNWNGTVTEVFAGVDMMTGPYVLDPGTTFTTPRAILVWSGEGRGEVSREFHRWARRHLMPHGDVLHPVLLNSWEGSYFSFTEQTLLDMMDGVKEMGGEMFVLDDGWFGRGKYARDEKNRDRTGLGDWVVNRKKLPRGLGWISDEASKRGLKFGLWVEPEMANVSSWLAQEHPEWILREKHRTLALGRGGSQVVLDMTNPAVRDNIFNQIDAVYSDIPDLAYVKWDANQNIVNPGSLHLPADRQGNLWYDYTMGYYSLLARFQAKRPHIMVQACASGGGHMDFGSLRYADEFWASDNTDPYSRVFIQWGASQFYPASAMACHVTKRSSPIKYRFDVAMTGRMGFELNPKHMPASDVEFSKAAVADYKRIRPIVQRGDLYRLVSPYEKPLSALMYVGEGRSAAVVFALGLKDFGKHTETLKLRGLDPEATYSIKEINCGERLHLEGGWQSSLAVSGRDLMERGLAVMLSGDYDSAVFEICKKEQSK